MTSKTKLSPAHTLYLGEETPAFLATYKARLNQLYDIVNYSGDDITYHDDGSVTYCARLEVKQGAHSGKASVSDNTKERMCATFSLREWAGQRYVVVRVAHEGGRGDFTIQEPVRPRDPTLTVRNPDQMLDYIDRWDIEADRSFDLSGSIGAATLRLNDSSVAAVGEILAAAIYSKIEFGPDDVVSLAVQAAKPYGVTSVHQIVDGKRFEIFVPELIAYVDRKMPDVSQIRSEEADGLTNYRLSAPAEVVMNLTRADQPSDAVIVRTLKPLDRLDRLFLPEPKPVG